ncbi:hypothetical protein DL96DRAFT_1612882 [Flagelloscypha sp. PMI_526]|nr:hypothetical protein DL96DRAFT_1612882 [Flagelloscypha sp. PMI_526]
MQQTVQIYPSMSPQVWLITGTSSGLGRAATEHVLSQGDIVIATARNTDSLKDLISVYPPTHLLPVSLDVLKSDDIKAAFATAIEHYGRVDVVYSNSGIATQGEFEGVPEETARKQFDVNEAVRVFREVNQPVGGRLLIASSINGVSGMPAMGYYSASKFAVEGLHESLSKEVDPSWNIKFNTPGLDSGRMEVSIPHPAYAKTAAAFVRENLKFDDKTPVPSVCAEIVYGVAKDPKAPLRVPVGLDAIEIVSGRAKEGQESSQYGEQWKHVLQ